MNLELLNQIEEAYRTGNTISLRVDGVLDTKLVKDIHELYISGYLHLPKYCRVFGYARSKSIRSIFKKMNLKTLDLNQINEMYGQIIVSLRKETNLERFGIAIPMQSPEIRERVKQTNLERYGVENAMQSISIQEKMKRTNLERYGVENPFQSHEIKEKIRSTNLERYGVVNPSQSTVIRERVSKTILERFGVMCSFQSHEIKEKIRSTILERYGVEHALQSHVIKEKIRSSNLGRYGVDWASKSIEVKDKMKQTNLARYGYSCPLESPEIQAKSKATRKSNDRRYAKLLDLVENEPDKAHQFVLGNYPHNHAAILRRYGLYQENLSSPEVAIREILEKHKIEYQFKYRPKFMEGKELDFFIPNKNLAIEVNGLYWHSYPKKDKYYHQDKHLRCRSEGIQLLSFTEDQILEKSEIIESMILHKLGLTPYRVYAKNCTIRELRSQEAKDFLEKNHLHGFSNASTYLGLEYEGKLVHVMSFGNNRFKKSNHPELIRSASLRFHSVAGGFQRLLKYYKRSHGVDLVESYVDFNISNGQSYELASKDLGDLGDSSLRETVREKPRDNLTEPDLWFVFRNKRYRRQMFMKHNLHKIFGDFPKRSDSNYGQVTVREFLKDRGVLEYYGAGNLKYLI